MRIHHAGLFIAALIVAACGTSGVGGEGGGDGSGGGSGVGGGGAAGGGGSGGGVGGDLPCSVVSTLQAHCMTCHGAVPSGGASFSLLSRDDLGAPSAIVAAQSVAQRAVARMRQATAPMPPAPAVRVPDSEINAFEAWVVSGLPVGSCGVPDGGAGGGGGGTVAVYDGGTGALPCDVSAAVAAKCKNCHGAPLTGNAPFPLLNRADFLQISLVDPTRTRAQQSVLRIHNAANPMPPAGSPAVTAAEVSAFDAWVNAGTQAGPCSPLDAGPQPLTCASGQTWTLGTNGSESMEPGLACIACHRGQNFNGQNPTGLSKLSRAYSFMGTAFSAVHDKNLCRSPPPAGGKVEIIDKNGGVALTLLVTNPYGNFRSNALVNGVALPYTARITANGRTATMVTPQTNGDCNECHTEQGLQGAPGRIYWP